jgi:hypothetical protein
MSRLLVPLCLVLRLGADAYNLGMTKRTESHGKITVPGPEASRRNLLRAAAALSTVAVLGSSPRVTLADDDVPTDVYFGVGVSEGGRAVMEVSSSRFPIGYLISAVPTFRVVRTFHVVLSLWCQRLFTRQ